MEPIVAKCVISSSGNNKCTNALDTECLNQAWCAAVAISPHQKETRSIRNSVDTRWSEVTGVSGKAPQTVEVSSSDCQSDRANYSLTLLTTIDHDDHRPPIRCPVRKDCDRSVNRIPPDGQSTSFTGLQGLVTHYNFVLPVI